MKKIFVYGSNTQGIDGAGAALFAHNMGRPLGIPMGLHEKSLTYAIITKHLPMGERSVSLQFITTQIGILWAFAEHRQDLIFNVTRIGCGRAGFTEQEIAPMFKNLMYASNIILCDEFKKILKPI